MRCAAVMTAGDDDILVGAIDRYGDSFIKDITFAVKQTSVDLRVFTVSHNPALQLGDVVKTFI
ncbi:hypothetical protein D3C81_1332430 [compost metagenome]